MFKRSLASSLALSLSLTAAAFTVQADNEQYFPLQSYRVGPYAAGGTGFFGGFIDYLKYVNANGGVNGVKLTWSECETEYVVEKRRRVLRAPEERLERRTGGGHQPAVGGHRLRHAGAFDGRQTAADHHQPRSHGLHRWQRVSLRLPVAVEPVF